MPEGARVANLVALRLGTRGRRRFLTGSVRRDECREIVTRHDEPGRHILAAGPHAFHFTSLPVGLMGLVIRIDTQMRLTHTHTKLNSDIENCGSLKVAAVVV